MTTFSRQTIETLRPSAVSVAATSQAIQEPPTSTVWSADSESERIASELPKARR